MAKETILWATSEHAGADGLAQGHRSEGSGEANFGVHADGT